MAGTCPFQRVWKYCFFCCFCFFFVFFDDFFFVLPLPLADAWGKMVFVLMVVQFLFLWSFFLVRCECSLCSQIEAYFSEKLDSQGFPFCFFFGGGAYLIYLYIEEGSTSHILVYLGGSIFFFRAYFPIEIQENIMYIPEQSQSNPREPEKHQKSIMEIPERCHSNPIKLSKDPHGNTI